MLFDLPPTDELYEALLARDVRFDGRAFVGVTSTGIFCRLTCPARKPKLANCRFYPDVAACLEAGFRPCKRCRPLHQGQEPLVARLLDELERDPAKRWGEADLVARGLEPSTVRRVFKRQLGLSFLELARLGRLRQGFTSLAEGEPVIDAQLDAGYASPAAFRKAFAALIGKSPGQLSRAPLLKASWIETRLGDMIAVTDDHHLHLLEFADRKALAGELKRLDAHSKGLLGIGRPALIDRLEQQLRAYFDKLSASFDIPLKLHGSPFSCSVWRALQQIPAGETRSYGELAKTLGQPAATRAVARANGANQIAILIPCHRVIGADGTLTGYGGGLWRKRQLIEIEQALFDQSNTG